MVRVSTGQGSRWREVCLQSFLFHTLLISILVTTVPDAGYAVRMMGVSSASGAEGVESVDRIKYVVEGDNVSLDCNFDLEGEQLYTLLWWKDDQMLLRYLPGEYRNTDEKSTEIQGKTDEVKEEASRLPDAKDRQERATEEKSEVTSHHNGSYGTAPEDEAPVRVVTWFEEAGVRAFVQEDPVPRRLLLIEVSLNVSGEYVCEVTTEAPTYYTVRSTTALHVMVPPRTDPKLEGDRGVVGEGANVHATCTSSPSLPTPTVTFWINDKRVVEQYMTPPLVMTTDEGEVEVQRSVEFRAHRGLFNRGTLLLQCRVILHDLVWNATSKLLLENYDATRNGVMQVSFGNPCSDCKPRPAQPTQPSPTRSDHQPRPAQTGPAQPRLAQPSPNRSDYPPSPDQPRPDQPSPDQTSPGGKT